jgi:protein-disulfide isomerase
MKKLALIAMATALLGAAACQQDSKNTDRKLDEISKRLESIEQKMGTIQAGAGRGAAQQPRRRPEPDPKDVYAVPVDGDPSEGPADALVTIVKGYEYACPFCEKVRPTMEQLLKDYPGKIRIVHKQFVVHPQVATDSSLAACASHKQGKFAQMDKLIWEKAFGARKFDRANIDALAKEAGLDMAKFKADMEGDCKTFIQKDQADLQAVGQGATPTFFINGRYMSGAQPVPAFKAIIDEEIKKAEERIAQGTSKADYYKTWVLDKGLKKFVPKVEK